MKTTYRLIIAFCILTLFGCVNKPLRIGNINTMQSFSVNEKVTIPDKVNFISGAGELLAPGLGGAVGGAIGGAIVGVLDAIERDEDVKFTSFLKSNNIDIGNIVYTRFVNHIQQHPLYNSKYKEDGVLTAHLSVLYYSVIQKNIFFKYYRPGLLIKVQFKDRKGKVIAEGRADAGAFNSNIPEETQENFKKNPRLLEDMFSNAADEAIRTLLGSL